jgi:hypothetical protein
MAVFNIHFSYMTPTAMPAPGFFKLNEHFNHNPGRAKRRRE